MIDFNDARSLIRKHRDLATTRQSRIGDIHAIYACDQWATTDENASPFGGRESVEDGSIYGVIDTKVAATTPLRPRVVVTPEVLEEPEPGEANPTMLEEFAFENLRRRRFAQARQRYIHHLFHEGQVAATYKRLNTIARIAPHAFLRADWSPRHQRPMIRAFSPLEVWVDDAADTWDDVEYIIHATFLRKHEVQRRVQAGLYEQDLVKRLGGKYGKRPTWSRMPKTEFKPDEFMEVATVYEVHDLVSGTVLHVADAFEDEPLLSWDQPWYQFLPNPFHYIHFAEWLAGMRGISDGEVLHGPAQRIARLAAIEYFAGKAGVPDYILNHNAVDDPKVLQEQWAKPRRPGSTLQVGVRPGLMGELVGLTPTPNTQPALAGPKQTAQQDLAFRAGVPSYQRGEPEPRVAATYGALQQQAEATRRGWDIQVMQGAVTWTCEAFIAIAEEFMPAHAVVQIQDFDPTGHVQGTSKVHRASMDFRDPAEWAAAASLGATPTTARSYFYSVEPYEDPMAKNPQAQIALDMQLLQAASTGLVPIDPMAVVESLRQSLGRGPDFIKRDWTPPQQQQAPGAMPGAPQVPADNLAAGGMPPGVQDVPTPAVGAMAGGAGAPAPVPAGMGQSAMEPTFP